MEVLGKIFNSPSRVKLMRLFLLNETQCFDSTDIVTRSKVTPALARRELALLVGANFIKRRSFIKTVSVKRSKKIIFKKKRAQGFCLNYSFPYLRALAALLVDAESVHSDDLLKRIRPHGKIKLILAAGVFTQNPDSRLDLLVVGDHLKRPAIERTIRGLEAEIGKELAYAVFETDEFLYRANMYDKLVRDIVDFPHEKVLDQGLLAQVPQASS
jgi:hypothetical protein